jgi:glyceraldehyde 3-phosphate dehydrogenase
MAINVAINGFGRIGRQLARQILSNKNPNITLKAVNTLENAATSAHLLKYDSCYGIFPLPVSAENNKLIIDNDASIAWHNEPDPSKLSWAGHHIDIVLECSGANSLSRARKHLQAGAEKVMITAAVHNPDVTLCMGVNHTQYDHNAHHIISGSSCTANCIAPVAKIILENYGIVTSMATIIHSYTNTQNLLDNAHDNLRRSRSATKSLIPTQTSAVWQVPEVIPQLKGKFDGLAVRVPTPLMHLADVSFILKRTTTHAELMHLFEDAAQGPLKNILALSSAPLVGCDFRGSGYSSIIDIEHIYNNNTLLKLLLWHDNEYSYCSRIIDLLNHIGQQF